MTKEQALALAASYVARRNQQEPLPEDYTWVVGKPTEHADAWYFPPAYVHRFGSLTLENRLGGVNTGFLLWKRTQAIDLVAERDVPAALHRDTLGAQAADLATALLAGGHLLVAVRRHLRLPVHQMLDFVEQLTEASEAARHALLTEQLYQQALKRLPVG